jgi:hypothetical protein
MNREFEESIFVFQVKKTNKIDFSLLLQLVFHPPFNGLAVGAGLLTAWCLGYGAMAFGARHQQYKQGFKK